MLHARTSSAAGPATTRRRLPTWTALLALVAAVAVVMALPAAASASAAAPNAKDRQKARAKCANERGLTKAKHQRFRLKYGGRNAFNRCVKQKARTFARRRSGGGGGLPGLGIPGLPGMPTLPGGIPEMPGVRLECQAEQMSDPIGFMQEYPGGIETCVMMESMP